MKGVCSALLKLLCSEVVVSTRGGIRIDEKSSRHAKCLSVSIKNCTGTKIVVDLDRYGQFSQYINEHHAEANKSCDAVVFCTYKKRNFMIFVELKSDNPGAWRKQLKNSERFVGYLCTLLETHHGVDTAGFEKVFFLCTTRNTMKKTVCVQKKLEPLEDCPEKCFILPCNESIYLDNLNL